MSDLLNLSRQIQSYGQEYPATEARLWMVALRRLDPEALERLAAELGGDQMADSLAQSLRTLARERETAPFSLGGK